MKQILLLIAFLSLAATTEQAVRTSNSEPEVVVDDVNRLKDKVINSKTQNLLFRQLTKAEAIESSFPILKLVHVNEMSTRYTIFSMTYNIDKDRVFTCYLEDNSCKLNERKEINVFKGPLVPGNHEISVEVIYRGNDTGVFSYINEYKIPVQLKKALKVERNKNLDVAVVAYEKGWALTDFKDRPALKFKINGAVPAKDVR